MCERPPRPWTTKGMRASAKQPLLEEAFAPFGALLSKVESRATTAELTDLDDLAGADRDLGAIVNRALSMQRHARRLRRQIARGGLP